MTLLTTLESLPNKGRTILFQTVYGSKLYGCDLPDSDHDIRGVYAPGLYDIVRGWNDEAAALAYDPALGDSTDVLFYALTTFVDQVFSMKNNCVEILCAAEQAQRAGAQMPALMAYVLSQRDTLLTANPQPFTGHARQRCAPYIQGIDPRDTTLVSTIAARDLARAVMARDPAAGAWRLQDVPDLLADLTALPRVSIVPNKKGLDVLFIHTRQADLTTPLATFALTLEQRVDRFQKRSEEATDRQRFKDLSTALRMMENVATLMRTGTIAFPIPTAERHRAIRQGAHSVPTILDWIDAAQADIEDAQAHSVLRTPGLPDEEAKLRAATLAEVRIRALEALGMPILLG